MSHAGANLSFSEFYNRAIDIFDKMKDSSQKDFRAAVAIYYRQNNTPKSGWKTCIGDLIGNSETQVTWPSSFLDDIKYSRGKITRTIAFYYYLHSLVHDLSFAKAVDEILFADEPEDERTFAHANGGQPVFKALAQLPDSSDHSWKSALFQWELVCKDNRPANGLLASLSIERTQGGDTREPIALVADVHIRPAYEHESGIELRFNSVHIELTCKVDIPAQLIFTLAGKDPSKNSKDFFLEGSSTYPYVTVSSPDNGLNGNYVSDTLAVLSPNCQNCSFGAALRARIMHTNVTFPADIDLLSIMKRQIIRRMVEKAILPKPDAGGLIALHELQYNVLAVEFRGR